MLRRGDAERLQHRHQLRLGLRELLARIRLLDDAAAGIQRDPARVVGVDEPAAQRDRELAVPGGVQPADRARVATPVASISIVTMVLLTSAGRSLSTIVLVKFL